MSATLFYEGRQLTRIRTTEALESLVNWSEGYREQYRHGSMSVEIYKPDKVDHQEPHEQDELYVIASGSGIFINGDTRTEFKPGDVLFVPAKVMHRFEDFTDDFATWVIFYGPDGGESP